MSALITMGDYISDFAVLLVEEHSGNLLVKTCKRCFREFDESEVDVVNVSSTTELADFFLQDIGVEDIHDLCLLCREELGVMNLLGFGE